MLITKQTKVKWNSKNKKHYVNLGYEFTKMGDEFTVNVCDLTKGSSAMVEFVCDYCGEIVKIKWINYHILKQKDNKKDCCSKKECTTTKSREVLFEKYGTTNLREFEWFNEKVKNTNIEKFGCENPFGNEEVKNKIKQYYLNNFGVENVMQIPEYFEKARQTCIERYGVDNYTKTKEYRELYRGENSPVWKGGNASTVRNGRELPEYRDWRKEVFSRDLYTCKCCRKRNGNGEYINLHAHHIYNWKDNIDKRYDVNNGVTLCVKCHMKFHSIYGKKNNTKEQYDEFLKNNIDEKVC